MNSISNAREILRYLTMIGLVGATASTASAYVVCNGDNGNNQVAPGNPGCERNTKTVDCWEDPSHTPPQWSSGKTYARTELRICSTVPQLRAYAFEYLKTTQGLLGAKSFAAHAEAFDRLGNRVGNIDDTSANGSASAWLNVFATIVSIRSSADVYF